LFRILGGRYVDMPALAAAADWIERRPSSTLAHAAPGGATHVGPAKAEEPTDRLARITLRALAVDVNGSDADCRQTGGRSAAASRGPRDQHDAQRDATFGAARGLGIIGQTG
jgi:hypothetical protein